jgi:hypothetical protein
MLEFSQYHYPSRFDPEIGDANMPTVHIIDTVGWLGSAAVVSGYALLSAERLGGKSVTYHLLNLFGAACLILNGAYYGAYPSAFVNVVWIMIAFSSIAKISFFQRREPMKIPVKPQA